MLRSRSRRAVGAKQGGGGGGGGFIAEPAAGAATAQSPRSSASAVFPSPRPFMAAMALPQAAGFLDGGAEGPASAVSPTSILETKQFCCSAPPPPFLSERGARRAHMDAAALEPAGVGLADVLRERGDAAAGAGGAKVVFGSQLRVQVPSAGTGTWRAAAELVSSPIEFGAKNRDAVLLSPARRFLPPELGVGSPSAARALVSPVEMAMSEDYTCVISRGPNPRTRHIFDDCIVESCGDVLAEVVVDKKKPGDGAAAVITSCHACNKQQLGDGFIYRGDKAFCSSGCECRYQEMMLFDEAVDNLR